MQLNNPKTGSTIGGEPAKNVIYGSQRPTKNATLERLCKVLDNAARMGEPLEDVEGGWLADAVAEIEKLQAQLDWTDGAYRVATAEIERLQAENEKLHKTVEATFNHYSAW